MAYPPAYTRAYSFTDFETLNPGQPKPGDKLDTEYDAVSNALTGTQNALALIQRADGALANDSVGADQLQDDVFDGIVDGITADAEAAADAAAASASLAAGSAAAADASATAASTDAAVAAGSAAQAGVSQGIAQDAANEAALSATDADNSADVSVQAANDTAGSVAACEAHVQRAFDWAELLTGPVLPAPPGWPEAVDDGMFSSKWWAIRARDYNATSTIDLGTAGADIGEAFDIWDAIPGNDLGVGQTYATWGTPPHTYVLIDRSNPSDPASWQDITGGPGPPGPPNSLTIGTVTTGAPGSAALADITGTAPNQVLSLTIPAGSTGATGPIGPAGPPNTLAIGTVTTVPNGTPSAATITGVSPNQTLNLTLTAGPQGIQGIQGIQGPPGDISTGLAADSHVTGDWFFDPTTFFGYTATDVAAVKANANLYAADAFESAHFFGRLKMERSGGSYPVLRASRFNGTLSAPTPILNGDLLFEISGGGAQDGSGNVGGVASIIFSSTGNWVAGNTPSKISINVVPPGSGVQTPVASFATNAITFGDAVNNPAYNFLGTGLSTFGGSIVATGAGLHLVAVQSSGTGDAQINLDTLGVQNWTIGNQRSSGNLVLSAATDLTAPRITVTPTGAISFGGQILAQNGTLAAPGYAFISDTGTGFFRSASNLMQAAAGGVALLNFLGPLATSVPRVTVATIISLQDGTAAFPAISFESDLDTGIYRGGSGTMAAVGNGTQLMVWSPSQVYVAGGVPFQVNDGSAGTPGLGFALDPDTGIYRAAPNDIRIARGGADALFIDAAGVTPVMVVLGIDGSAAAPSYSFRSDVDSGMYRVAADTIDIATGGVVSARFATTGVISSSFTTSSSRAIKRETGAPPKPASILARLRPIMYRLLAGGDSEQLGLIAEEVHEVCPQLSDGKSVAYDRLAILLLAAWQEDHLEAAA